MKDARLSGIHWMGGLGMTILSAGLFSVPVAKAEPQANKESMAAKPVVSAGEVVETTVVAGSKLDIPLGKSRMVSLQESISRVAIGNPAVADVKILDPKRVWVLGMGIGSTNLMLWDKAGNTLAAFDINVNLNVEQLNAEIMKLAKSGDVQVRAVQDKLVLEGRVPDQATADSVAKIVEVFGYKNVVNLLKVDARAAVPDSSGAAIEQIEIIRGTEMTTKQFQVPQR